MGDIIKVGMCDDDINALPVISGAVGSVFRAKNMRTEIKCFRSGKTLLHALKTERFHIIFLDIDMPEMDGIEVGKAIREISSDTKIIYVSECESRVFEAFQVQPLGFVRKSNFLNDITSIVRIYKKNCMKEQNEDMFEFLTRTGMLRLNLTSIIYIEGSRNYQIVHLNGAKTEEISVKESRSKPTNGALI